MVRQLNPVQGIGKGCPRLTAQPEQHSLTPGQQQVATLFADLQDFEDDYGFQDTVKALGKLLSVNFEHNPEWTGIDATYLAHFGIASATLLKRLSDLFAAMKETGEVTVWYETQCQMNFDSLKDDSQK